MRELIHFLVVFYLLFIERARCAEIPNTKYQIPNTKYQIYLFPERYFGILRESRARSYARAVEACGGAEQLERLQARLRARAVARFKQIVCACLYVTFGFCFVYLPGRSCDCLRGECAPVCVCGARGGRARVVI